ncbi:hypothetical protein NCAS_0C04580 [Naumovozyma castellii]|uniref:tRNA:m(4)X modification enzyme TRM13 n=1 Tax=Naumovozyma castellii TaxID=27288 RepID=G0VD86_NAUCA|nr:hypothetical protein NCAS_0C04580 [Naumovozyma castellii CBS 4309]CCC69448.1 hypothetical protein NCAS_0C04580 [Naumovozyma castellii CBS 4309]
MSIQLSEPPAKKLKNEQRLQCEYFIEKKQRRCGMTRKNDVQYCTEHLNLLKKKLGNEKHNGKEGNRVPCPLDPKHTVWESQLQKHLKKCNKTKQIHSNDGLPYFMPNLNSESKTTIEESNGQDTILKTIETLRKIFDKEEGLEELPLVVKSNKFMEDNRFKLLSNKKHAIQQSSLIQHMIDSNMLHNNPNFIEFGCGRAEFTRYVNQVLLQDHGNSKQNLILIDRSSNRMKFDKKIIDDVKESEAYRTNKDILPEIKRVKIDIRDLKIDPLLTFPDNNHYVAISKHLCGVATDLTLRCINNSKLLNNHQGNLDGICIAMCCRHVCQADDYINHAYIENLLKADYLNNCKLDYYEFFNSLKKMCSWATCGRREGMKDDDLVNITDDVTMTLKQREELGLMARRIIDEGRKEWVLQELNDKEDSKFTVALIRYVPQDVSLENVALIVSKADRYLVDGTHFIE